LIRSRCLQIFFAIGCLNLAYGLPIHAQSVGTDKNHPPKANTASTKEADVQLLPGVVVEKVEKNSEVEKAGLREGDVLLSWSRGDQQGKIESPYDISWLDIEQRPRGTVTVQGFRDGHGRSWNLGQIYWSLDVRPNLSGALLEFFEDFRWEKKAQGAGLLISAAKHPAAAQQPWLRSWFLLSGGFFAEGRRIAKGGCFLQPFRGSDSRM
jgi:hypothetical protein